MKKNYYLNKYLPLFRGKRKYLFYYIAGLVDGEGSFSVSFKKNVSLQSGWFVDPVFQVYQHERNVEILYLLRDVFGAGSVYRKGGKSAVMVFGIHSRRSIKEKVIPFFKRYPLVIKRRSFELFVEIVERLEKKEHFEKGGLERIYKLAVQMNLQGKGRKYKIEDLTKER